MQHISQSVVPENISFKDNWFTTYIEDDTREIPRHKPSVAPENKINTLSSFPFELGAHEGPTSKGECASDLKNPVSERVPNT